jgi:hypothetical protein
MYGNRASSSKKEVGPRCQEALSHTQRSQGHVPNRSVARRLWTSADSQAAAVKSAMHRNLDVFKDALFWGAMAIGVSPIVFGGALLVWLH